MIAASAERMVASEGFGVTLTEFETHPLLVPFEVKFAKGAVVVFPTAVLLFKEVVTERLKRFPEGNLGDRRFVAAPRSLPECDRCFRHGDRFPVTDNGQHFDLATVAVAVELDEDFGDFLGGKRFEDCGLIYFPEFLPGLFMAFVV